MRKLFPAVLTAATIAALSGCAATPDDDFYAYPDDYRATGNYRGEPGDRRDHARAPYDDHEHFHARSRYGDRDGDGVLNWRDRYPDDPSRY